MLTFNFPARKLKLTRKLVALLVTTAVTSGVTSSNS